MYLIFKITRINFFHLFAILLVTITTLFFTPQAEAVPAFARQMGMNCTSCHFQNFPALNNFGRVFRAQGFTMAGTQKMIEGDDLSLPIVLNASVITKLRYQSSSSDSGGRGEIQWPDEAALLVGGRVAEDVGFLMELGLGPQEGEGTAYDTGDTNQNGIQDLGETFTGSITAVATDVTGNFLSTKFHFNLTDTIAVIPFSTDGLGVGYGFELLNTGVQRSQRPIENRKGFSAGQVLGTASGGATGMAFVYHTNDWYINYSHWTPTWGNSQVNIFGGLANYLRLVYMPAIGSWDTGFGITSMSGSVKSGGTPASEIFVDSWTIDAQAQGQVGTMPLGIYASYGAAPKSTATEENFYNTSTVEDATAFGVVAKLGVIPGKMQVYLATASKTNGPTTNTTTIGLQYTMAENVKIELYNVSSDSDDDYTMLMLFAGI
ncbi:MAG: hypothetical protein OEW99_06630 [Gammaproteobacteria bacterium]|nr:hypothetical protein [Gammaproteobacteria bacterium]MDH5660949.1 hypothetical protein [Gammaproteobacteria bacterium]